ncbi:hypothetical protein KKG46_00170 [Patescibacteria group bacterium]|nr:hypothetical protein [Patescibacteria group bacterium]
MTRIIIGFFLFLAFSYTSVVSAMTSTNYRIDWDSINSGGTDFSTSTNFQMHDTLGEQGTGYGTSTNYLLHAGYRQYDETFEPSLSFRLGAQENSTQTSYTALATTTNTVTLSSVANFSTGSYIGVVENQGLNQNFIVGLISQINGLIITVDQWDGMTDLISDTPAGGDDYAYRLNDLNIEFGTIDYVTPKTGIVVTDVRTNAENGYTLTIVANGRFTTGIANMYDVSDGQVTLSSEEYGGAVYGAHATSTGSDFAITTTSREIQKSTTTADIDRVGMIYKVAIDIATPAGAYQQSVAYLLTANF